MRTPAGPTGHVDTFTRDNLPPEEAWPPLDFSFPGLDYPDRLNAAVELLDGTIARFGADRRALVFPGGQWTYGELRERVNRLANTLISAYDLAPGTRVL